MFFRENTHSLAPKRHKDVAQTIRKSFGLDPLIWSEQVASTRTFDEVVVLIDQILGTVWPEIAWCVAGAERGTNMTFHDFHAVFNTSIHRVIIRLYILDADIELLAKLQEIVAFEFWRIIASQTRGLEACNFQIFLQQDVCVSSLSGGNAIQEIRLLVNRKEIIFLMLITHRNCICEINTDVSAHVLFRRLAC